jgi:hypothetical protein
MYISRAAATELERLESRTNGYVMQRRLFLQRVVVYVWLEVAAGVTRFAYWAIA